METTRKQEKKRKEKEKINAFIIYHVIWTIFNQDWWPGSYYYYYLPVVVQVQWS